MNNSDRLEDEGFFSEAWCKRQVQKGTEWLNQVKAMPEIDFADLKSLLNESGAELDSARNFSWDRLPEFCIGRLAAWDGPQVRVSLPESETINVWAQPNVATDGQKKFFVLQPGDHISLATKVSKGLSPVNWNGSGEFIWVGNKEKHNFRTLGPIPNIKIAPRPVTPNGQFRIACSAESVLAAAVSNGP